MFGAVLRTALGWSAAIVGTAILAEIVGEFLIPLLDEGSLLFESLTGVSRFAPLIVTVAAVLKIIARGLAEREVVR
jgi:hypothetical protein